MFDQEPLPRNRAGRPVWFIANRYGEGTYQAVSDEGRRIFRLAILWLMFCGLVFPALFMATLQTGWIVAMLVACAVGMGLVARTIIRHS